MRTLALDAHYRANKFVKKWAAEHPEDTEDPKPEQTPEEFAKWLEEIFN